MATIRQKSGRWYAEWYDRGTGKRHLESLSRFMDSPVVTKRAAQQAMTLWLAAGRDVSAPATSILAFLNRYIERSARQKTVETQRKDNERLWAFQRWGVASGITHLSDITTAKLEAFRESLTCGPTTRYRYIQAIHAALAVAVQWKLMSENPAGGIKREPNYAPKNRQALSDRQVETILQEFPSPEREFCALAIFAGLRRSDIAYLAWEDVDLKERTITVRPKPEYQYAPKSTRYRDRPDVIPLTAELAGILKGMAKGKRFVFDDERGKPMYSDPDTWTHKIRHAMLTHGIDSSIHELRHTCITRWARQGINPLALRLISRHADIKTTLRYTHMTTEDLRREMEKASR